MNNDSISDFLMTKANVLAIFSQNGRFLRPDDVRILLRPIPARRSFYSYLGRLKRQGLLERHPNSRRGYLAYRLTARGQDRMEYLRRSGTR
jgi:hypothetical protein